MSETTVTVYSLPGCVQCDMTKRRLTILGITFEAVDLSTNEAAYKKVQALGHLAAPVVIVEKDGTETHWSGFRPDRLAVLA